MEPSDPAFTAMRTSRAAPLVADVFLARDLPLVRRVCNASTSVQHQLELRVTDTAGDVLRRVVMGVEGTLTLMPASLDLVCIDGGELGAHAVDPATGRTVTVGDEFHYRRFGRALSGAYKVVPCSRFSSWTRHDCRLL
jgi:hypothetical protein